jgi:hypothetical protein
MPVTSAIIVVAYYLHDVPELGTYHEFALYSTGSTVGGDSFDCVRSRLRGFG